MAFNSSHQGRSERKFILVTSKKILQEVERVLNYPKITKKYHLNKEKITDFLKGLSTFSEVCSPRKKILIIKKDLEDNKFIEAAVVTRADFIISGDRHLLELGEYQGTEIITAKEFLLRIQVYL